MEANLNENVEKNEKKCVKKASSDCERDREMVLWLIKLIN